MSCPDWPSLVRRRDHAPGAWNAALEHLDGCSRCRDAALDAEPTLLFRRLPAPEPRRDEIATMKEAVAALCRNSRPSRPLAAAAWLRAAALAAVLITGAMLQGAVATAPGPAAPEAAGVLAARGMAASEIGLAAWSSESRSAATPPDATLSLEQMPLVEYVDPAYGSVVEVVGGEMSLVLVLPPIGDV